MAAFSTIFGIIGIVLFILTGIMHEQVHKQIFADYGIESKVEYIKYFPHMATIPEKNCESENCELAHEINNAVGYHLIPLFLLIFFGFLTIITIFELIIFKSQEEVKKWQNKQL